MLEFHELAPSPNSVKIRMALRFKGIDFRAIPVDPADRAPLIERSGQELAPVIADRDIVLNDSEAILHYLDANYRDRPRLWSSDRAGRKDCDAWKERIDREVAVPWFAVFAATLGFRDGFTPAERQAYEDALRRLDDELGDRESFQPRLPICDLRVAEWAAYGLPGPAFVQRVPLFGKFREIYAIEPGSMPNLERFLAPWNERMG